MCRHSLTSERNCAAADALGANVLHGELLGRAPRAVDALDSLIRSVVEEAEDIASNS